MSSLEKGNIKTLAKKEIRKRKNVLRIIIILLEIKKRMLLWEESLKDLEVNVKEMQENVKSFNEELECLVNEMLAYSNEGEDKIKSTGVGEEVGSPEGGGKKHGQTGNEEIEIFSSSSELSFQTQ